MFDLRAINGRQAFENLLRRELSELSPQETALLHARADLMTRAVELAQELIAAHRAYVLENVPDCDKVTALPKYLLRTAADLVDGLLAKVEPFCPTDE